MISKNYIPILALILVCKSYDCSAENFKIKVLNEQNLGIKSRVVFKAEKTASILGDTDDQGDLKKDFVCSTGELLVARPFDSGAYFDSAGEPCKSDVILRVIRRQNPKGVALDYRIENLVLRNNQNAVIVYKGFVNTVANPNANLLGCSVIINSVLKQELYKVDGVKWVALADNEIDPSAILSGIKVPDRAHVTFPEGCEASNTKIQTLEATAAMEFAKKLMSESPSIENSVKSLGFQ